MNLRSLLSHDGYHFQNAASAFDGDEQPARLGDTDDYGYDDESVPDDEAVGGEGLWQSEVEQMAALAAARTTQTMRAVGSTVTSTLERWR